MRKRSWIVEAATARRVRGNRVALRRYAVLVPALAMALAVPQQCTEIEPGAGDPTPPATASAPDSIAEVDPCQLLDETTAAQVGIADVTTGEPSTTNSYRQCLWPGEGATPDQSYRVVVAVSDTLTLERIISDFESTPVTVGSREAVEVVSPTGDYCSVYIGIGASSLALSDVSGGSGVDSCGLALQIAQLIEPGLP